MLLLFNNIHRRFNVLIRIIFFFSDAGPSRYCCLGVGKGQFLARDHLIIDLRSGVEWMRCSVGSDGTVQVVKGKLSA